MATIRSTNLANPTTILVNNKEVQTGIYKKPSDEGIYLGKSGVHGDTVSDLRVHGGEDKACYIYPIEHYSYWKQFYPDIDMPMGMFGENITTEGFIELNAKIGAQYQIGEALVQVSQPRQPCYKLAYRFENPNIVKQFRAAPYPGIYLRVLKEGRVQVGDSIELIDEDSDTVSVLDVYCLLMKQFENPILLRKALDNTGLAQSAYKQLFKAEK